MTRAKIIFGLIAFGFAAAACSLVTSFDSLVPNANEDASSPVDGSMHDVIANDGGTNDAASDAGDPLAYLLSCDASALVAYWPMDEGSGTNVHDCRGGLDGTFGPNGTSWGTRADGGNLEFTGNGYVTMGVQAGLDLGGPFTVAGWFRLDTPPTDDTSLFWNYAGGTSDGFEITYDSASNFYGQVGLGTAYGSIALAMPTPAASTWIHAAVVFEPGVGFSEYENGKLAGEATQLDGGAVPNVPCTPDPHETRFGANYGSTTWKGAVDDVRLYSRALTAAEVLLLATH